MVRARLLHAAAASDPGRERSNNEDRVLCEPELGIFAVIDGVGGELAGEVAAETALEVLRARLSRRTTEAGVLVREAIALANRQIYERAQADPRLNGMSCVLTVVVLDRGTATVGHVGDSRLYALGAGQIRKVTSDHSPVGAREDAGDLSEIEAMRHPRRNEIFRDVGSAPHEPDDPGWIDVIEVPFAADGALLLCSDGLSDMIPASQILDVVESWAATPRAAVRGLIDSANAAGGKDNVSVVLVTGERFAEAVRRRRAASSPAAAAAAAADSAAAVAAGRGGRASLAPVVPAGTARRSGAARGGSLAAAEVPAAGQRVAGRRVAGGDAAPGGRRTAPAETGEAGEAGGGGAWRGSIVAPGGGHAGGGGAGAAGGGVAGAAWAPPATLGERLRDGLSRWPGRLLAAALVVAAAVTVMVRLGYGGSLARWFDNLGGGGHGTSVSSTTDSPALRVGAGDGGLATIGEALARARPGQTIEVAPGEYHERIVLRDSIAVVSQVPRRAILMPPVSGSAAGARHAAAEPLISGEGVQGAMVFGFQVAPDPKVAGSVGVRLDNSYVILDGLEVTGAAGTGIEIRGSGRCTVRYCYIHQNGGPGVAIVGAAGPRILVNLIAGNGLRAGAPAPGILVEGSAVPLLADNRIEGNGGAGVFLPSAERVDEIWRWNTFGGVPREQAVRAAAGAAPGGGAGSANGGGGAGVAVGTGVAGGAGGTGGGGPARRRK